MANFLLSCDWGTSNLRTRCVNVDTGEIIASVVSDNGIAKVYSSWEREKVGDRISYFRKYLEMEIRRLSDSIGNDMAGTPLVISGMASSRNGLEELPYAALPFNLDGRDMIYKAYAQGKRFSYPSWIISGIQGDMDVMRGEEVQMMGMSDFFEERNYTTVLPGTHSKHIRVQDGVITRFQTFMTGELFQLLSNHGLLSDSVEENDMGKGQKEEAFINGVETGLKANLLNSLFSVRVNELLNGIEKEYNWHFLSGLLIGYELKELRNDNGMVYLCGGNNLAGLYERACTVAGMKNSLKTVPSDVVEMSVVRAHVVICKNIINQ